MTVKAIVKKIHCRPLENAALYTESRRKLLLVAKHLSDENATKWPFLNPHAHCLRMIRQIERGNGELSGSDLLNCYEEFACRYVNDNNKW
jgi:hypothetical protein